MPFFNERRRLMIAARLIFLVGFMGVGKTTVGYILSNTLDMPFIDLDEKIEHIAQCSISKIFLQHGEGYFRELETQILSQLPITPSVVSTGGGIIGRESNWHLMRSRGKVVYLHASWPTIAQRLFDTTQRPLAENGADDKLKQLWTSRLSLYKQADVVVDTDNLSAPQVVDEIIYRVNRPPPHNL